MMVAGYYFSIEHTVRHIYQLTQSLFVCAEEEAPDLDDDGNELDDSEPSGKKQRRKEHVKHNPQFMAGVSGATAITDQPRLSEVQHKVQDMCEWKKYVAMISDTL